jgi:hypothetical protein
MLQGVGIKRVGRARIAGGDADAALGIAQGASGELGQILVLQREDDVDLQP